MQDGQMQQGMCLGIKSQASGGNQTQTGSTAIVRCTTTPRVHILHYEWYISNVESVYN
jgi:hypothetical protein